MHDGLAAQSSTQESCTLTVSVTLPTHLPVGSASSNADLYQQSAASGVKVMLILLLAHVVNLPAFISRVLAMPTSAASPLLPQ